MLLELLCLLQGGVDISNSPGIIGVKDNCITKVIHRVYIGSPAFWSGCKPGDKLISLEPKSGLAGEDVVIKVKRKGEILIFVTRREAKETFYEGFSLTKDGVKED